MGQSKGIKQNKTSTKKVRSSFTSFLAAMTRILFLERRRGTRLSPPFVDFPNISNFLRSQVLSCLATHEVNLHTKVIILEIKSHFTSGETNIY